jgi:hypothetical protein
MHQKKILAVIAVICAFVLPCCTSSLSLPVAEPEQGMASIKGGTVFIAPISAQYSYVMGVDGRLYKSWTGTKTVKPGKHQFLFGCSHAAGLKSMAKMTINVESGQRYLVEAKNWTEPNATYTVYKMPERVVISTAQVPLIGTLEYGSGDRIKNQLISEGWRFTEE